MAILNRKVQEVMQTRNVVTQTGTYFAFSNEVLYVLYDLRWMIVLMVVLIIADMWWGRSECKMRYKETQDLKYKFRFSRAGRRSMNKLVDYITYLLVGVVVGLAIFEPLGIADHITTASIGIGLGCIFDISSIAGHVCAVHHVNFTTKEFLKLVLKFAVNLLKRKHEDAGLALEDTLNNQDKD